MVLPRCWEAPGPAAAMLRCLPGMHLPPGSLVHTLPWETWQQHICPWGSRGFWGRGCVRGDREDADFLACPSQCPLLRQEKRRAERAEQQRIRSEREKERQARLAVSLPPGPGGGGLVLLLLGSTTRLWGTWGHKLCVARKPVHEVSVCLLLSRF